MSATPEPAQQPTGTPPDTGTDRPRSPFEDAAAIARATSILSRGYRRYLATRQQASAEDPDTAA